MNLNDQIFRECFSVFTVALAIFKTNALKQNANALIFFKSLYILKKNIFLGFSMYNQEMNDCPLRFASYKRGNQDGDIEGS